jgi:hypothetical protein
VFQIGACTNEATSVGTGALAKNLNEFNQRFREFFANATVPSHLRSRKRRCKGGGGKLHRLFCRPIPLRAAKAVDELLSVVDIAVETYGARQRQNTGGSLNGDET